MTHLTVHHLSHTYPARRKQPARDALRDVSFSVDQGAFFGLLGPNGGGKSTTFQILATLLKPTSGQIHLQGVDVVAEPERIRRLLGVVFQNPSVDKKLTIQENLRHQGRLYGMFGVLLEDKIRTTLEQFALWDRRGDFVETLSGGLRRRVEIAKALLHSPSVLLLDEPTTGLDPIARRELWQALAEMRRLTGLTILVTTHLMEEAETCDHVAILNDGQLVAEGTPEALKREIGGDVITLETAAPQALAGQIQKRFDIQPRIVENTLLIERARGHEFIPTLVSAFPGDIQSVHLGKPSLEDVFIRRTGKRLR